METQSNIVVISKAIVPELQSLADDNQITIVKRVYKNGDLKDAFMVIVMDTSDSSINHAVHQEAYERNIVCNVEDVTDYGYLIRIEFLDAVRDHFRYSGFDHH